MKKRLFYGLFLCLMMMFSLSIAVQATEAHEKVVSLEWEGVNYGKVILSGEIDSQRGTFDINYLEQGRKSMEWVYENVLENSICTIEPANFEGYIIPSITAYTNLDGVYTWTSSLTFDDGCYEDGDDLPLVQLFANNQAQVGWGYGYREFPVKYGSPTSFVFGYNNWKNPVHGDEYSYTFRLNDVLYVLECVIFNNADEEICYCTIPIFVRNDECFEQQNSKTEIRVLLNGEEILFDQPPIIIDDRTMVPVRAIFEALGANVEWFADTQTVLAQKDERTVTLKIDSNIMRIGNKEILLDVPAQITNSRTLVPARAVAEAFECLVDWDKDTQTVLITN